MRHQQRNSMSHSLPAQRGASLLIVLILAGLMTFLVAWVIRSQMMSGSLAQRHQMDQLLFASSDAVMFYLENPQQVAQRMQQYDIYGYFQLPQHSEDELALCFRSQQQALSVQNASVVGDTRLGEQGFCQAQDFATARENVMTQIYLRKHTGEQGLPEGESLGQDGATAPSAAQNQLLDVAVVSISPNFSGASATEIAQCFRLTAQPQVQNNVIHCFQQLNVPYQLQRASYRVGYAWQNVSAQVSGESNHAQ
ncbi:MAG: hypothetical protein Q4D05_03835 [Acinetobacter sp.]|nr:hypothetical protein [Acinetobacter sp.]